MVERLSELLRYTLQAPSEPEVTVDAELAVLKTLGFTELSVAGMVVAESLVISLLGLALGLGGAMAVFNLMQFDAGGFVPGLLVTPRTAAFAGMIAVLIGLVSGLVPAIQSARLRVVDALRYVA